MIRKAKTTDYVELKTLSFEDLGYECNIELVKSRLDNLDPNNECVFVAEVNSKVVGYVHIIKFNTLYYKSMANIQGMVVAKEHQRKGYGKEAVKLCVDFLINNYSATCISAPVHIQNISAQKFWKSLGFKPSDSTENDYNFMRLYLS